MCMIDFCSTWWMSSFFFSSLNFCCLLYFMFYRMMTKCVNVNEHVSTFETRQVRAKSSILYVENKSYFFFFSSSSSVWFFLLYWQTVLINFEWYFYHHPILFILFLYCTIDNWGFDLWWGIRFNASGFAVDLHVKTL